MEFIRTESGNMQLNFSSPINIDNGVKNIPQGTKESTMELFEQKDRAEATIEWVVNDGEFVEHIGCWFENGTLTDYDGVFEIPNEALKLLRKAKYIVPSEFESSPSE